MVIPHRDWLLLRGRMRAVAKISVLPLLLTVPCSTDLSARGDDDAEAPEDKREA
jgi:hypothetical protein